MNDFEIGDRVYHADHGLGTVGWLGADYVGIAFDVEGKALLQRGASDLRLATREDETVALDVRDADLDQDDPTAREQFLVFEEGEVRHFMGSHWDPFFEDVKPVLEHLPEALNGAQVHGGYSETYPPPAKNLAAWPRGLVLLSTSRMLAACMGFERRPHPWDALTPWRSFGGAFDSTRESALDWSDRNTGIATILRAADAQNKHHEVATLFPYCFAGIEHSVELERVHVWESGLEAQVEASLGETSFTFFDVDFVNNRDWYQRGRSCQFILTGIAYDVSVAEVKDLVIPRTEEWFDSMEWLTGENRRPVSGSLEEHISTEGMSMFLPVESWDIDDYSFRGPVKEVWGMSMLGLRAWRVRVTVMRLSGHDSEDVNLDIVISEKVWKEDAPPQVGQELEGHLWLQGRLWLTHP